MVVTMVCAFKQSCVASERELYFYVDLYGGKTSGSFSTYPLMSANPLKLPMTLSGCLLMTAALGCPSRPLLLLLLRLTMRGRKKKQRREDIFIELLEDFWAWSC